MTVRSSPPPAPSLNELQTRVGELLNEQLATPRVTARSGEEEKTRADALSRTVLEAARVYRTADEYVAAHRDQLVEGYRAASPPSTRRRLGVRKVVAALREVPFDSIPSYLPPDEQESARAIVREVVSKAGTWGVKK